MASSCFLAKVGIFNSNRRICKYLIINKLLTNLKIIKKILILKCFALKNKNKMKDYWFIWISKTILMSVIVLILVYLLIYKQYLPILKWLGWCISTLLTNLFLNWIIVIQWQKISLVFNNFYGKTVL